MNVDDSGKLTDHVSLGVLTRIVPRYVVDEVIAETGRVEKRSRLLPAHVVVYFVLALSLFTDGYEEVIRKLVHCLRFARTWSKEWQTPTTGALSQARARLGEEPLQALFETVAVPIAKAGTPGAWLRNWRLMALDGVMIDMPDTPQKRAVFHKPEGGTRRPFPQSRTVGLTEAGTHAVIAVTIGTIRTGERELAHALLDSITPDMLVVADHGFYSFDLWRNYRFTGADLLWRLLAGVRLPVLNTFPDGSYLSEITNQPRGSKTRISADKIADIRLATHIPVRVVEYQVAGATQSDKPSETFRIITSITDPEQVTAVELADAYHQRWEIESAFREIETYLRQGEGIRSKTPAMVRQELYGLFITHYAIRAFMIEAADTVDIDPDRISFTRTLHIIRRRITDPAEFSPHRPQGSS
jgi:Insertion element 4 transposase N-terminal/Transposase DDE domain